MMWTSTYHNPQKIVSQQLIGQVLDTLDSLLHVIITPKIRISISPCLATFPAPSNISNTPKPPAPQMPHMHGLRLFMGGAWQQLVVPDGCSPVLDLSNRIETCSGSLWHISLLVCTCCWKQHHVIICYWYSSYSTSQTYYCHLNSSHYTTFKLLCHQPWGNTRYIAEKKCYMMLRAMLPSNVMNHPCIPPLLAPSQCY